MARQVWPLGALPQQHDHAPSHSVVGKAAFEEADDLDLSEVDMAVMSEGVQRWAVNTATWQPGDTEWKLCLSLLDQAETEQVNKFMRMEDRKRAMVSRLLQRQLVHKVLGIPTHNPQATPLPPSCPFPNFNFNASHHGDYVVIASEPLCLSGADIMSHAPSGKKSGAEAFIEAFRNCFTEREWRTMRTGGTDSDEALLNQFYRYWTMKEAYVKAVGAGLGFALCRAEFRYDGDDVWAKWAGVWIDGACTARGPPLDAIPSYRSTLRRWKLRPEVCAAAIEKLPEPSFSVMEVKALLPEECRAAYDAATRQA
eukprot:jgi/Chlat1/7083/Chrsp57S06728